MLTWKFASPEEFLPISDLFESSGLGAGEYEVSRRIGVPLLFRQIIAFYENSKLCGFVTFAFMGDNAEKVMPKTGISPADWQSGGNFWVVDFVAKKNGYKMLRLVTKGLGIKHAKYFRHKYSDIREVVA